MRDKLRELERPAGYGWFVVGRLIEDQSLERRPSLVLAVQSLPRLSQCIVVEDVLHHISLTSATKKPMSDRWFAPSLSNTSKVTSEMFDGMTIEFVILEIFSLLSQSTFTISFSSSLVPKAHTRTAPPLPIKRPALTAH